MDRLLTVRASARPEHLFNRGYPRSSLSNAISPIDELAVLMPAGKNPEHRAQANCPEDAVTRVTSRLPLPPPVMFVTQESQR